jgi:membrane protease YdiL (CAAX protease family)
VEIPGMLIVFSLPSIIYAVVQTIRGIPFSKSRRNLGWTLCKWTDILLAAVAFAILALIAFIVLKFIPQQLFENSSSYSGQTLSIQTFLAALFYEAFYVALGEEIFFRGFIGSWLFRKIGFRWGNLVQATIFLLPHLMVLTISVKFWPVFIIQFSAGWLQGWLLKRSGSILPGWLVHTASNLVSAISVMG